MNHLEPARGDPRVARSIAAGLGLAAVAPVQIEGGWLMYEWIGERNHLNAPAWGRRGDRCTSLYGSKKTRRVTEVHRR